MCMVLGVLYYIVVEHLTLGAVHLLCHIISGGARVFWQRKSSTIKRGGYPTFLTKVFGALCQEMRWNRCKLKGIIQGTTHVSENVQNFSNSNFIFKCVQFMYFQTFYINFGSFLLVSAIFRRAKKFVRFFARLSAFPNLTKSGGWTRFFWQRNSSTIKRGGSWKPFVSMT